MRLLWAACLACGLLAAVPAGAMRWHERPQAPWCAVYPWGFGDTRWDCVYPSLKACVPNVIAGTRGFCNPNPRYQAPEPGRPHRRH